MNNPVFNMKSVKKYSYKANVGAGAEAGAENFWKSEPERKQKVSAPQHWLKGLSREIEVVYRLHEW